MFAFGDEAIVEAGSSVVIDLFENDQGPELASTIDFSNEDKLGDLFLLVDTQGEQTGELRYTPFVEVEPSRQLIDTFEYTVRDSQSNSATAEIVVTIVPEGGVVTPPTGGDFTLADYDVMWGANPLIANDVADCLFRCQMTTVSVQYYPLHLPFCLCRIITHCLLMVLQLALEMYLS